MLAGLLVGCSAADDASRASPIDDAGSTIDADTPDGEMAPEAGVDAAVVPAFIPEMPQIVDQGGVVLAAPTVVTVVWASDPNRAAYEAFGDAVGASDYWKATAEYGIGAATSKHVEMNEAAKTSMTEDALAKFVTEHVEAAPGNGWPAWDASTMYVVFVPEGTDITSAGASDSYVVQKMWSNAAAKAGHDPCVRSLELPYFNTTPLDVEPITVTTSLHKDPATTKGFRIPVGTTKTIRFGFYSDANLAPWAFSVVEGDGFKTVATPRLTITTTTTSGKNGDVAEVFVTANSVGSKTGNLITAISVVDGEPLHYMPVLVGLY